MEAPGIKGLRSKYVVGIWEYQPILYLVVVKRRTQGFNKRFNSLVFFPFFLNPFADFYSILLINQIFPIFHYRLYFAFLNLVI